MENNFVLERVLLACGCYRGKQVEPIMIEKKLIVFGVLAIVIGVASITPLVFLMSGKVAAAEGLEVKAQFSLDVPYAFIRINGTTDSALDQGHQEDVLPDLYKLFPNYTQTGTAFELSDILSFKSLPKSVEVTPEAVLEYYNFEIYTDKESLLNSTRCYGGAYSSSINTETLKSFFFNRNRWFNNSQYTDNALGTFEFVTPLINNGESFSRSSYQSTNELTISELPQRIYLTVSRVSTVFFYENSTIVSLASAGPVKQITLEKYENGYLYNTLFTQDQLSKIDLLYPKVP